MFTWICPKCGGEVPPAYDDCPRCHPAKKSEAPVAEAEPVAEVPRPTAQPVAPPPVAESPRPLPAAPPPAPVYAAPPPPPPPVQGGHNSLLVGLGSAIAMAAVLAGLYFFVLKKRDGGAAPAPAKAALETPAASGSAPAKAHPFAKHLEVAGVRVIGGKGGEVKVQYIVVNHSAASLPEMKLKVSLLAGGRDFFDFPSTVPSLGPYEVKELTTTLKTQFKPYEIPDWQMLQSSFAVEAEQ